MGASLIGATRESIETTFGPGRQNEPYRPDLYPISYEFLADNAKIDATFLDGKCLHAMVAYEKSPEGSILEKLALFSGLEHWAERPSTDSEFAIYFPLFDPVRNRFFVEQHQTAFAMVQQQVALGELVVWLSQQNYPRKLQEYRSKRKAH
jgi:hypothetical protein